MKEVRNFKPEAYCTTVEYRNPGSDSVETRLYLEVKYRLYWFLLWCEENGKKGFIDESQFTILSGNLVAATVVIKVDEEEVARATAAKLITAENANDVVQYAFTAAKGRALANLGFGTVMDNASDAGDPVDAGIRIPQRGETPSDQGVPTIPEPQVQADETPADYSEVSFISPVVSEEEPSASESEDPLTSGAGMPAEDANTEPEPQPQPETTSHPALRSGRIKDVMPSTLEEAFETVCGIGKNKGLTLREIVANGDISSLEYYTDPGFRPRNRVPGFVAAATMVLESIKKAG